MSIVEKLKDWSRSEPTPPTPASYSSSSYSSATHSATEEAALEEETLELIPRMVRKSEIVYFASQLSVMVDTGINLSNALQSIGSQTENPTFRRIILDLRNRVEGGEDFSIALARHPRQFGRVFVSLIRASEQTGSMGQMLEQVASYLAKEVENRNRVRAALTYPFVMLVLAACVTVFLLTYIMPKFAPIFQKRGVKLPKLTVFMMHASDSLLNYWWLWLAGSAAAAVALFFWLRTEQGRRVLDWCKITMPILGPIFRRATISRSIRTLGVMVGSGVPMLDAVRLCAEVSGNYHYERCWRRALDQITNGNRICDALQNNRLFPATLVQMIGAGEETGRLDYVLMKVSTHYDREVDSALKAATSMIEPLMITVMGGVVGSIAMSLLLPIFQLSRNNG